MFGFLFSGGQYKQDAALVRKYTGVNLTPEQFERYKNKLTLRKHFGTDRAIARSYHVYGISGQFTAIDIMNDVLDVLSYKVGLVFDIEKDRGNEPLFKKLLDGARFCLTQDQWPRVRAPYNESPRLIKAVKDLRSQMNLRPMEKVL